MINSHMHAESMLTDTVVYLCARTPSPVFFRRVRRRVPYSPSGQRESATLSWQPLGRDVSGCYAWPAWATELSRPPPVHTGSDAADDRRTAGRCYTGRACQRVPFFREVLRNGPSLSEKLGGSVRPRSASWHLRIFFLPFAVRNVSCFSGFWILGRIQDSWNLGCGIHACPVFR